MPRKRKEDIERELAEGKIHKPQQRFAANARERSRMRVLSKAFSRLKTTLPWVPPDTKLSKLDTLRLASSYIAHLKQILDHEENLQSQGGFIHPLNLTWPFTFNGRSFGSSPSTTTAPHANGIVRNDNCGLTANHHDNDKLRTSSSKCLTHNSHKYYNGSRSPVSDSSSSVPDQVLSPL